MLRRLTRAAVEDIGLADPNALVQCLAAKDMYDFLGSPEGELGDRPGLPLSRHRAQIERHLHGAESGVAKRQGNRLADAAGAHPQRPDQADEGHRLRQGLCLRPRRRRRLFRRRITGPRRWSRRPSTSRPTAASKPRCASGWTIGTSGAKSCNKATASGLSASDTEGASDMYQIDQGAYWQAQMMYWGPEDPHRDPDPRRDLDRRPGGQMGAPEGDRPHAGARST